VLLLRKINNSAKHIQYRDQTDDWVMQFHTWVFGVSTQQLIKFVATNKILLLKMHFLEHFQTADFICIMTVYDLYICFNLQLALPVKGNVFKGNTRLGEGKYE